MKVIEYFAYLYTFYALSMCMLRTVRIQLVNKNKFEFNVHSVILLLVIIFNINYWLKRATHDTNIDELLTKFVTDHMNRYTLNSSIQSKNCHRLFYSCVLCDDSIRNDS